MKTIEFIERMELSDVDDGWDDGFQNEDQCDDWKSHDPQFEWTEDDWAEFEWEERVAEAQQQVPSWSSLFCEESEYGGPPFKCLTFFSMPKNG